MVDTLSHENYHFQFHRILCMSTCLKNKFIFLFFICLAYSSEYFGSKITKGTIELDKIDEASGIVMSRNNSDVFWVHNDSGDKNILYAVGNYGQHIGSITIKGASSRDWEDISIGPGPKENEQYIYVGDIGDNLSQYNRKYIYRFIEPKIDTSLIPFEKVVIDVEKIIFEYPDGKYDAESLFVDPQSKDIIILTKREKLIKIYTLPYPQKTNELITAKLMGKIDFYPNYKNFDLGRITAASISKDGSQILIKSYIDVFLFDRDDDQTVSEAIIMNQPPKKLTYSIEPQGEALCWDSNNFGFYTLSEEKNNIEAVLYFYPLLIGCMDSKAINFNPYAITPNRSCLY